VAVYRRNRCRPSIIEAVAFHHTPECKVDGLTALTIVHAANAFANAGLLLANGQTDLEELDYPYLERKGIGIS
jgi:hypothetical protein